MYRALLFLHVLAVVAYLGPSLGGSFVCWRARRSGDAALLRWTLRQAVALYGFEHRMLGAVLLTGAALLWQGGWALLEAPWFRWKLGLIAAVLLPVEAWDVWVVARVLGPALRDRTFGDAMPGDQALGDAARGDLASRREAAVGSARGAGLGVPEEALRAHARVLTVGGVLFAGAVLPVLWLSVAGQG